MCRDKCVIAFAKRKRPPLGRGHHWSPASKVTPGRLFLPHGVCMCALGGGGGGGVLRIPDYPKMQKCLLFIFTNRNLFIISMTDADISLKWHGFERF